MLYNPLSKLSLALVAIMTLSACNNTAPLVNESTDQSQVIGTTIPHATLPTWSYKGNTAPEYWGELDGNELCKVGIEQSPINIQKVLISSDKAPQSTFVVSDIDVVNNGHTVMFTPKNNNNVTVINGETYTLQQIHYHTPSEHQISSINYPGELHFVHANTKGDLAVLGVMINPTAAQNTTMSQLLKSSITATRQNKSVLSQAVQIDTLLPNNTMFYNYTGSLTTPPCSEQVEWFVATEPLSITQQELLMMQKIYSDNNRPVQPINDRKVLQIK